MMLEQMGRCVLSRTGSARKVYSGEKDLNVKNQEWFLNFREVKALEKAEQQL